MIKILLVVLFISSVGILGNSVISNAQNTTETNSSIQINPPSTDIKKIIDENFREVAIHYQSDSMVVLWANAGFLHEMNKKPTEQNSWYPFSRAIDVIKNQGYSLGQITQIEDAGNVDIYIIFEK